MTLGCLEHKMSAALGNAYVRRNRADVLKALRLIGKRMARPMTCPGGIWWLKEREMLRERLKETERVK